MASDIAPEVREQMAERAAYRCEYCLLPQAVVLHKHEPDHIVPRQHGGEAELSNLALACLRCNRYKGPNVGSFDPLTDQLVPFFNPRTQRWDHHFQLEGAEIRPLTPEGRVTVKIMRMNDEDRMEEQQQLIQAGLYP